MTTQKKMTSADATAFVQRIELLNERIGDVHAEIVQNYSDGPGALSVITEAVKSRAAARDEQGNADGLLGSFDAEEPE